MALAGLGWLAAGAGADADAAEVPVPVLAECLRGLEQVLAVHTAARARILGSFTARRGFEDDGQGSPRTWLTWQTQITRPAASAAAGWMRRLRDHLALAAALTDGRLSVSWARQIADWTDQLPADARPDADLILLAAAAGGADLAGLSGLAEEIRRRTAGPDRDPDDGFTHRGLRLATTLGGAGRLQGDVSARCAAALQAVLDSLGKKAGARGHPHHPRTPARRAGRSVPAAARRRVPARPGRPARPAPAAPDPGPAPERHRHPRRPRLPARLRHPPRRVSGRAGAAPAAAAPTTTPASCPAAAPAN